MKKLLLSLIFLMLLTGCKTIAKNYLPDEMFVQSDTTDYPYITKENMLDISLLGDMSGYNDAANKSKRNEVISKAISMSDQKCTIHKAQIISNANTWNVGASTIAILLAGTASVIGHAQTASELAAGASAASGIQASVNKEIYADALATTIIRAIDSVRTKKKAILENGMDSDEYTMAQAIIDIQSYHDGCSMMAGLVEVTRAIDNRKPSRNELERNIKILRENIVDLNSDTAIPKPKKDEIISEWANSLNSKVQQLTNSTSDN